MTETAIAKKALSQDLSRYDVLLRRVRETIAAGKERALRAVEREKVRTAWETGKLILEHILLNRKRGSYGSAVMKRLAKDIHTSYTEIRYMVEFAREYPKRPDPGVLTWGHYRELLAVNDVKLRTKLEDRAKKEGWDHKRLRSEIRKLKRNALANLSSLSLRGLRSSPKQSLKAAPGIPDTYRLVIKEDTLKIDLGFSTYLALAEVTRRKLKPESLVRAAQKAPGRYSLKTTGIKAGELFTYSVNLIDVTDADTIWVYVDLGFGITSKQKLRFRGIDAPEINTRAGLAAKAYVEAALKPSVIANQPKESPVIASPAGAKQSPSILMKSTKSDKYDRYLADIWYEKNGQQIYLNQELIDAGHAVQIAIE